jgi:hypothetical protein
MGEPSENTVIDYEPKSARYRPSVRKTVFAVARPWVIQAIFVALAYLPSSDGLSVERGRTLMGLGLYGGIAYTFAMVFRSSAPFYLKFVMLILVIPVQFLCLAAVMQIVGISCGAGDAM